MNKQEKNERRKGRKKRSENSFSVFERVNTKISLLTQIKT